MSLKNISEKDVRTAYHKLKTLAYYDNSDLFLKSKIASYETEVANSFGLGYKRKNFEKKINDIFHSLTDWSDKDKEKYWNNKLDEISFYALPKQVKSYSEYQNEETKSKKVIENIFTNVREIENDKKYEINSVTLFIDAPIEVYIVSILWTMKLGYILDIELDQKCYGNRLILEKSESSLHTKKPTEDEGLFKPYYKQYQKWRDEGISVAKDYLDKKENVLFINLDIKNYYYSVRMKPEEVNTKLQKSITTKLHFLNELFWNIHYRYTKTIKNTGYPNKSIKNTKEDEIILPIGLHSSYILANWYLKDFDKRVNEIINPVG